MFSTQPHLFQPLHAPSEFMHPDDILPVRCFSEGSSPLPWYDHQNFYSTLGLGSTRHSFSNTNDYSIDATGQKSSSSSQVTLHAQPQEIYPRSCQWPPAGMHARPTPINIAPNASTSNFKSQANHVSQLTSVNKSPPTTMTVPLTSDVISDRPRPNVSPPALLANDASTDPSYPASTTGARRVSAVISSARSLVGNVAREKRHCCWMCHKSFDRPSTLRKHLLVHTGERAHVCETCGRRFGVASNLNRHVRRCLLRPVHSSVAGTAATKTSDAADQDTPRNSKDTSQTSESNTLAGSPVAATSLTNSSAESPTRTPTSKRARPSSSSPSHSPNSSHSPDTSRGQQQLHVSSPLSETKQQNRPTKRRRRAPSPSRWIPFSLLAFDLSPIEFYKSTMIPLPPVKPSATEERDSWDENVGIAPYREDWKGKLPGPGLSGELGRKDVGNIGDHGGYFMGRLSLRV